MQILAFLFFATVFGFVAVLIRSMLAEAGERIEAAFAGYAQEPEVDCARVYVMRRRPALASAATTATAFRLAA